ncbi:unnamed protein product [Lepidochelys olivacea]
MKMCKTILPCILLLSVVMMAVAENITASTVPDTRGETTVAPVMESTVPDTRGETTVAPVTEATVPDTTGETTVAIVHKDNNLVNLPLGPEKEQQLSGLGMSTTLIYLGDVMAVEENIIEATVPDTTGKTTVAPVMEVTVPDTTGETTVAIVHKDNNLVNLPLGPEKEQQLSGLDLGDVMAVEENIIEATVPDTTGKTTVAPVMEATVPDTTGKTTVAPVMEVTVPDTTGETTVAIVHKDNNLVNLPLGPEKEQQLSGLGMSTTLICIFRLSSRLPMSFSLLGFLIGLSISFGILLICGVIIYCCIWKKSRKTSFDLNSVEVTIPLNPIETKEPS